MLIIRECTENITDELKTERSSWKPSHVGCWIGNDVEMTGNSEPKEKTSGYTHDLHGQQLPGKGRWSYFVTKLA